MVRTGHEHRGFRRIVGLVPRDFGGTLSPNLLHTLTAPQVLCGHQHLSMIDVNVLTQVLSD
jgi:hypothetical protein